jgi:hypothetical protein
VHQNSGITTLSGRLQHDSVFHMPCPDASGSLATALLLFQGGPMPFQGVSGFMFFTCRFHLAFRFYREAPWQIKSA